uniref:Uncharacterized protein n=1 Tax=Anguilla anguilla TaxID=7936 RepID=A0A0E9UXK6_ANGAN
MSRIVRRSEPQDGTGCFS